MWIKLYADHGAGHQSHSEKYVWFDEMPEDELLEDYWHDWVNREYMHEHISGGSEVVSKLPDDVAERLLEEYRSQEKEAQKMIRILEMRVHGVEEKAKERTSGWGFPILASKGHYFDNDLTSLCGRWAYTGELHDEDTPEESHCRTCEKKRDTIRRKKYADFKRNNPPEE